MGLETATFINGLDATNPTSGDPKSQGDDHIRLVKSTIKATFPNVTGAVTVTHTDLNTVTAKANKTGDIYSGTHDMTGAVVNVLTQAITDNTTKAASTAYVQSAILNSTGVTAQLPAQAGNSGRYLTTNGSTASWGTVITPALGGASATDSVTLTASSAGALSIAPTGYGKYVTLPDATTCNLAAVLFSISNKSGFPVGIKDNAGTVLGWVPPQSTSLIGLSDKSTAAGVWCCYGSDPVAITSQSAAITYSGLSQTIAIDTNRTFILLATQSGGLFGIVHDASTNTFGSQTLIRTGTVPWHHAVLSATNQILVCSCNTTAFEAVVLSISGTTITVNTAATATLAGNIDSTRGGGVAAIGTTYVVWYGRATSVGALRALTISGTTVTINAEVTTTPNLASSIYAISGTVGIAFGGNGTNIFAVPFSVSGATITLGTQASWAGSAAELPTRVFGNRFIVLSATASGSALVSVSGTTATASTFTLASASNIVNGTLFDGQISATKWLIGHTASQTTYVGILTDNSGTASYSQISLGTSAQGGSLASNLVKLTNSRASIFQDDVLSYTATPLYAISRKIIELDVSGATPSVLTANTTELNLSSTAATDWFKTLAIPGINYTGSYLNSQQTRTSVEKYKLSGASGVLGITASQSINLNGAMPLICGTTGSAFRAIRSLTLQAFRDIQDNTGVSNIYRIANYLGSDRRIFGISSDTGKTATTIFSVECAA